MKRPLYLVSVLVYRSHNKKGDIIFDEIGISDKGYDEFEYFLRFYIVPRKGEIIKIVDKYYKVFNVQYEGFKKSFAHVTFYVEAILFAIEIGNKVAYEKMLLSDIKKALQ